MLAMPLADYRQWMRAKRDRALKAASNGKAFTVRLGKTPGSLRPRLMFAIASSKPWEALTLPPDASRAEQVFPRALTEAEPSQILNVSGLRRSWRDSAAILSERLPHLLPPFLGAREISYRGLSRRGPAWCSTAFEP
jgi:hypothetical protein